MGKKTFVLETDLDEKTKTLTDEELGKVFRKILKYVKEETLPKLTEKLELVFQFIKVDLDKNLEKYQERCKKNKEAAERRWNRRNTNTYECMQPNTKHADNDSDNDNDYDYDSSNEEKKESKPKKKFVKPNLEEVIAYCKERKNKVDPQKFIDYYESNGWKVGRNSMKDWKAAIRTWERNDGNFANKKVGKPKENVPSWFDKKIKNEHITKEEQEEMDKLLEEFK